MEDTMFRGYDKIHELGFIEDDFIEEDKKDKENNISIGENDISEDGNPDRKIDLEIFNFLKILLKFIFSNQLFI